jgi:flagellar biosynthesis anti-sigma factor FlgM
MVEMDLLREAFRQRRERLEQSRGEGEAREKRPSLRERLQDPSLADAAKRALAVLGSVPDVRRERVEEIKKKLEDGSLVFDSKSVADRLLQESILNELL